MSVDIGGRLRHLRMAHNLSQRELAKRAGVTNSTISLIESNASNPSVGALKRILKKIADRGWMLNIGPEPEFFLFKASDGNGVHPVPHDTGGYFDFSSFDEAVTVRTALMEALDGGRIAPCTLLR